MDKFLEEDEKVLFKFRPYFERFKLRLTLLICLLVLSISILVLFIYLKWIFGLFFPIFGIVLALNFLFKIDRKRVSLLFNQEYFITNKRLIIYNSLEDKYEYFYLKDYESYYIAGFKPYDLVLKFKKEDITLLMVSDYKKVLEVMHGEWEYY